MVGNGRDPGNEVGKRVRSWERSWKTIKVVFTTDEWKKRYQRDSKNLLTKCLSTLLTTRLKKKMSYKQHLQQLIHFLKFLIHVHSHILTTTLAEKQRCRSRYTIHCSKTNKPPSWKRTYSVMWFSADLLSDFATRIVIGEEYQISCFDQSASMLGTWIVIAGSKRWTRFVFWSRFERGFGGKSLLWDILSCDLKCLEEKVIEFAFT